MDRNNIEPANLTVSTTSLSARRAWIEICGGACARRLALLSLSARRAWIEILTDDVSTGGKIVALRKESVDRNVPGKNLINGIGRRSPQGERG